MIIFFPTESATDSTHDRGRYWVVPNTTVVQTSGSPVNIIDSLYMSLYVSYFFLTVDMGLRFQLAMKHHSCLKQYETSMDNESIRVLFYGF